MKAQLARPCQLLALTALGLAACSGQIGDNVTGSSDDDNANGGPGGPTTTMVDPVTGKEVQCRTNGSLASARISLITDDEYVNVARDVFGVMFVPETVTASNGVYPINEAASVGSLSVVQMYSRAADQIASKIKPCGAAAVTAACLQTYLEQKLPLAWKRPVTPAEMTKLIDIYKVGEPDGVQRGLNLVMEAALGAGAFLYRTEVGEDASAPSGTITLSPYELASAVSFTLTDSVPDPELWKTAVDGSIARPAVLGGQVDRLLAQPATRANLAKKVSYYLNMEKIPVVKKDTAAFPQFTASLQASLYDSAQKFLDDIVWSGKFSDLFTNNSYYANREIATTYDIPGVSGTQLVKVTLPAQRNAGFLSQPGFMATSNQHTGTDDIVHRGLWIYDQLACGITIGAPPPSADSVFKTLTGTERVRAQKRDALPQCGACHGAFDPFGMVSENFDVIGRYRTIDPDDMLPVVSTTEVKGLGPDIDGPVSSLKEIADKLVAGRRAADCAAVHLAKYSLAHNPDVESSCEIQKIKDNFASTGKFVDFFKSLVTSPAFATRDLGIQ
jgi:hypothetical protein